MLLPWWSVQDHVGLEWVAELAFVLAAALAALFVLLPRRYALALPARRPGVLRGRLPPDLGRRARSEASIRGCGLPGHPWRAA